MIGIVDMIGIVEGLVACVVAVGTGVQIPQLVRPVVVTEGEHGLGRKVANSRRLSWISRLVSWIIPQLTHQCIESGHLGGK